MHIATSMPWLQQRWSTGDIEYEKIDGPSSVADILTKHVLADLINRHIAALGLEFPDDVHKFGYSIGGVGRIHRACERTPVDAGSIKLEGRRAKLWSIEQGERGSVVTPRYGREQIWEPAASRPRRGQGLIGRTCGDVWLQT